MSRDERKTNKTLIGLKAATNFDLENMLKNVIPFHISKLAESFINQVVSYLIMTSQPLTLSNQCVFSIFFESTNLQLHKLVFDEGPDVVTLRSIAQELFIRKFHINDTNIDKFKQVKSLIDDLNKKYKDTGKLIEIFRNNIMAHILTVPFDNMDTIHKLMQTEKQHITSLIKELIIAYKELLNFYGYTSDVDVYLDFDAICKSRLELVKSNILKIQSY